MRFRYVYANWTAIQQSVEGGPSSLALAVRCSFTTEHAFNKIMYQGFYNEPTTMSDGVIGYALAKEPYLNPDQMVWGSTKAPVVISQDSASAGYLFVLPSSGSLDVHGSAGSYQLIIYSCGKMNAADIPKNFPHVLLLECED